jgi:pyruvate/2-oxoglutarate dehydrogenase complex dihydrolipoamide acyltransferase (E2) component
MANVDAVRMHALSPFRRIALGTWRTPMDPQIYGTLKLRMEPALAYIEDARRRTGQHVTVTHMVIKAIGAALAACGDANVVLRGSRPYRRRGVDVSVLVAVTGAGGKADLSATKIEAVDGKTPADIAAELDRRAQDIRAHRDDGLRRARRTLSFVPTWLMGLVLRFMTFLSYTLNLDLRRFGVPRDPFGAAVVSSIGSLGLESALIPLVAYSAAPIVIAAGAVTDEPVVEGDRVVPGKVMRIGATFDHRIIDGSHAAVMVAAIRRTIEEPWTLEPAVDVQNRSPSFAS